MAITLATAKQVLTQICHGRNHGCLSEISIVNWWMGSFKTLGKHISGGFAYLCVTYCYISVEYRSDDLLQVTH